jgi:hypothetical protein
MAEDELGPMPEPEAETPELHPGGTDAVVDDEAYPQPDDLVGRDLHPERNPGAEEHVPDEITVPDDKQQEPDEDSGTDTPEEPPA